MNPQPLLQWQWQGYPRFHRTRRNLLIHIVAVPVFLLGNVFILLSVFRGEWLAAVAALAVTAVAFSVQGLGHKGEPEPAIPFSGPLNAVTRIFAEQWITFPRFVLSGGWLRAWKTAN